MILSFVWLAMAPLAAGAPQDTTAFAQGVDYRIEARLDEETDVLHGRARLRYTNNAPRALDTLYLHQHLNAFRPQSAWARRELEFGNRRFTDLGPDEHAFERFTTVRVDGEPVNPMYPGAPDSTVAAIPLARPLTAGETVELLMDWDARLSTLPRRQGRRGSHYDWAQWYPRIAVYDRGGWQQHPLLPQGEFYGEFGDYDVTLDVSADQVVGATGVPVTGDPGWEAAAAESGETPLYRRDAYPDQPPEELGLLSADAEAGRKRIRWRADDVHHFAWTANPEYIYEGGSLADEPAGGRNAPVAIHVLYQPGDTAWDDGVVVQRTAEALRWLETMFGPYPWPQLTNVHRIEDGGTEFPMMLMDGSASEGLIVHEGTHQYLHGILANNEWKEGWLDEGFTSFITNWYFEDKGGADDVWAGTLERLGELERAGRTQPVATPAAEFRDFGTYGAMTYSKGSAVFYMLRELVGEETMRQILRTFFDRYQLRHVDEAAFRTVAEEVSGRDLDWFFDQWLHTTQRLDYAVGDVRTERTRDGWRTHVDVLRLGGAWMPITLRVGDETRTLDFRGRRETIEVVTRTRPDEVVLDPDFKLLDIDPTNNRRSL